MKTKLLLSLVLFAGSPFSSVHAQLIHLSFRDFDGGAFLFHANHAETPWDHTGGPITQFDIIYDAANSSGVVLDPTRNIWRARIETESLGNFEVIRPLSEILVSDDTLTFRYSLIQPVFDGTLEFTVKFAPPAIDSALPVPPFSLGESFIVLNGGKGFFDIEDLAEGLGFGPYQTASAEIVRSADFTPVPEPATYGFGAVLLMGLSWWRRHFRPSVRAG